MSRKFYIAALTGRSGAGKSSAARLLAAQGVPVIDCDAIVRELEQPGEPCFEELVRVFSQDILAPDGTLDRGKLAALAFGDLAELEKLNTVTHKYVIARAVEHFDALREKGFRYCVIEAAALIESGLYTLCDRILLVTAPQEVCRARIAARDRLTDAQAQRRLAAQIPEEQLRALADRIIDNGGGADALDQTVKQAKITLDQWFGENERL